MMRTRNMNAELIRVMACLIVIGVHCDLLTQDFDSSQILWRVMLGDGVTYFFIIMGFFLFRNKSFFLLLKDVILRIMLPGLVTMFLIRLFFPWIHNECGFLQCIIHPKFDYIEYAKSVLNWSSGGGDSGYLWYLFTYLQVVMLVPIMKLFCREDLNGNTYEKIRFYVIGINLFGMMLRDAMAFIRLPSSEPYGILTVPAMMTVAGYTIYARREQLKENRKVGWLFLGGAVVIELIRWRLQLLLSANDVSNTIYLMYNTSFAFIVTVCVTIFIMTLDIKSNQLKKVLTITGKKTFAIYLIHYPILCFLDARGFGDALINTLTGSSAMIGNFGELAYILIRIFVIFSVSLFITLIPGWGIYIFRTCVKRLYKA